MIVPLAIVVVGTMLLRREYERYRRRRRAEKAKTKCKVIYTVHIPQASGMHNSILKQVDAQQEVAITRSFHKKYGKIM